MELNDPLDLNGQVNFYSENKEEIKSLVNFLFKQMLMQIMSNNSYDLVKDIKRFISYEELGVHIATKFSARINKIVTKSDLYEIISIFCDEKLPTTNSLHEFSTEELFSTLDSLFAQFLNNSSVACFSKDYNSFLMWSHYASGHTGVCLEFDVTEESENICHLPVISSEPYEGKYLEWTIEIHKVRYSPSLTSLRFYDYLKIFENQDDIDLVNLSKSYWHQYANGVKKVFLEKLAPWSGENEWRIVSVEFQESIPEDRIYKYNSSALSGVYFGARSSEETKSRVRSILEKKSSNPVFYTCNVDGTRAVSIEKT